MSERLLRSPEAEGGGEGPAPVAPRRAGSMTLREGVAGPGENAMDPANQSLADALRVMMRLLQGGMVILAGLYLLSGLHSVNEGERGMRLLFGNIVAGDLEPGLHWSAPFPMGDIVRVSRGYREVDISKDFWIYVPPGAVDPSPEKQAASPSLKPDQAGAGSVITGDGNVAHTKWKAGYERDDVGKFARNVMPEDEDQLVRAAVKRGVVQAVARVSLDDLLRQNSVNGQTVQEMAKKVAQETLDRLDSGIKLEALTMDPPIPPLYTRTAFNAASAAAANANKVIQEAQTYRSQKLNVAAGNAAKYLVHYIDEYELDLAKKDAPASDKTLDTINKLLTGEAVEVLALDDNGKPVVEEEGHATGQTVKLEGMTTGDTATTLNEARLYRSGVVSKAKSDESRWEAKLAQWQANPAVMVQNEWSDAMRAFMGRGTVTMMFVPPGVNTLTILVNQDPDVLKDQEKLIKDRERIKTEKKRLEDLNKVGSETNTVSTMGS